MIDVGFHRRMIKVLPGVVFLLTGLLLGSCMSPSMPADAEEALLAYWASLPSDPGLEHEIVRAWPGVVAVEETNPLAEMAIWCVETRIAAADDPTVDGEKLVWIVTRNNEDARWQAALLATMSSTWPYEACGRGP